MDRDKALAALEYLIGKGLPSFQALELLARADREHLIRFGRPLVSTGELDGPVETPDMDRLSESDHIHLVNVLERHQPTTYECVFPMGCVMLAEIQENQEISTCISRVPGFKQ